MSPRPWNEEPGRKERPRSTGRRSKRVLSRATLAPSGVVAALARHLREILRDRGRPGRAQGGIADTVGAAGPSAAGSPERAGIVRLRRQRAVVGDADRRAARTPRASSTVSAVAAARALAAGA